MFIKDDCEKEKEKREREKRQHAALQGHERDSPRSRPCASLSSSILEFCAITTMYLMARFRPKNEKNWKRKEKKRIRNESMIKRTGGRGDYSKVPECLRISSSLSAPIHRQRSMMPSTGWN